MAERISHRSRRSSVSFCRLTVKRTTGTAAPIRINRIVVATISSTRVTPRCDRDCMTALFLSYLSPLVHCNRGLPTLCLDRLVLAVARSRHGDRHHAGAFGLGNKYQTEYGAFAGNAG